MNKIPQELVDRDVCVGASLEIQIVSHSGYMKNKT